MFFGWKKGKFSVGYSKIILFQFKFPFHFNLSILKYPPGSEIPWHKAHGSDGKHYTLLIELWPAWYGGNLQVDRQILGIPNQDPYIVLFREDKSLHRILMVRKGTKYLLRLTVIL